MTNSKVLDGRSGTPYSVKAIVDKRAIRAIAADRARLHKGQDTSRPLSKEYELVGLSGEVAFSKETGYPLDLRTRIGGDNGVDFYTSLGTVDVKTSRKPYFLVVEQGKVKADVYVLAQYDDESKTARLLGWEYGSTMKDQPIRDFGFGVINHYKAVSDLRNIWELTNLLKMTREASTR